MLGLSAGAVGGKFNRFTSQERVDGCPIFRGARLIRHVRFIGMRCEWETAQVHPSGHGKCCLIFRGSVRLIGTCCVGGEINRITPKGSVKSAQFSAGFGRFMMQGLSAVDRLTFQDEAQVPAGGRDVSGFCARIVKVEQRQSRRPLGTRHEKAIVRVGRSVTYFRCTHKHTCTCGHTHTLIHEIVHPGIGPE